MDRRSLIELTNLCLIYQEDILKRGNHFWHLSSEEGRVSWDKAAHVVY